MSQGLGTINVSNNIGTSSNQQIATSGSNVYVTWVDTTSGNVDIFFAASNNNGVSFSTPINLSNNTGISANSQIAVSGNNNVYVTWIDDTTPNGNADIFFAVSNNNGTSFGAPINLSNNTGFSNNLQIATSGNNNVYVTWSDNTPAGSNLISSLRQVAITVRNFATPINLSNNTGNSFRPQIATSGNNVYVTWDDTISGNVISFLQ